MSLQGRFIIRVDDQTFKEFNNIVAHSIMDQATHLREALKQYIDNYNQSEIKTFTTKELQIIAEILGFNLEKLDGDKYNHALKVVRKIYTYLNKKEE